MSMDEIKEKIENVEEDIAKVVKDIEEITKRLENETNEEKKKELREDKRQLMEYRRQLMEYRSQLMEDKRQLREEKLLLLRKGDAGESGTSTGFHVDDKACAFQSALLNAQVVDKVLKFTKPLPWQADITAIFVREAYVDIYDLLQEKEENQFLVVGNPGTGKSLFAVYVLYKSLPDGKLVLFHVASEKTIYVFQAGHQARSASDQCSTWEFRQKGALYLYDAATRHTPAVSFRDARVVVFSSPSRKNIADLIKAKYLSLHMPIWSREELLCAAKLDQYKDIDVATVEDGFSMFGGIPRYVLEVDERKRNANMRTLQGKISQCDMRVVRASTGPDVDVDFQSHMIFHRNVTEKNYYDYELHFASPHVGKQVLDRIEANAFEDMKAFVKFDTSGPTGGLRGFMFEQIVHKELPRCCKTYDVRKLSDGSETARSFPVYTVKEFDSMIDGVNLSSTLVYLKPRSKTFESADALCPPDCIFQMTISTSHSIKANGLKKILKMFEKHTDWKDGTRINYYFVVPEDVYESFKNLQKYVTKSGSAVASTSMFDCVDQYVLKFDF